MKRSIKKIHIQVSCRPTSSFIDTQMAIFKILINTDENYFTIERDVYLNNFIDHNLYYHQLTNFENDKSRYLEIESTHLKNIAELKNCCIEIKFYEDYFILSTISED